MQVDSSKYLEYPMFVPSVSSLMSFDIDELLNAPNSNFEMAPRLPYSVQFGESAVQQYTIHKGVPLVLTNTTDGWDKDLFSLDYIQENYSNISLINSPRDNETHTDLKGWTVGKYCDYLKVSPEERNPKYLYAKDVQCPGEWREYIYKKLAKNFAYQGNYDLMSNLPEYLRTENLQIYIGSNGTYTPGHMDNVGSNGHNIMLSAADNACAYWFVIGRHDANTAIDYWTSKGGDIFNESRFLNPRDLLYAPFKVYIIRQSVGDFVLVPPESVHQVINTGGPSIKIAWNTISHKSLPISYYSALPRQKRFSKPEIYRIKAIVYYTLKRKISILNENSLHCDYTATAEYIEPLLEIFNHIVQTESILIPKPNYPFASQDETIPFLKPFKLFNSQFVHDRRCDHCNSDIFNRCYHCPMCRGSSGNEDDNGEDTRDRDGRDYCFECVSHGNGCEHHFQDLALKEYISHSKIRKELDSFYDIYSELLMRSGMKHRQVEDLIRDKQDKIYQDCGFLTSATLAYHVIYHSSQKEMRCHQCDNYYKKYSIAFCCQCSTRYCQRCIDGYNIDFFSLISRSTWKCFSCAGICTCVKCRQQQQQQQSPNDSIHLLQNRSFSEDIKQMSAIKLLSEQCMLTEPIPISSPPLSSTTPPISSPTKPHNNSPSSSTSNLKYTTPSSINNNSTSSSSTSSLSNSLILNNRTTQPMVITNLTSNSPNIHSQPNSGILGISSNNGMINNRLNGSSKSNQNTGLNSLIYQKSTTTTTTTNNSKENTTSSKRREEETKYLESKKRPIQYNEKPKGRPPKNLKEWTNSHKYILGLIEMYRNNTKYTCMRIQPEDQLPDLVRLYLENRDKFGGVLWAKTINFPLLPCLWVRDLTIIPPSTKLLPSLRVGKKIVVLFFGDQEEYVGIVGKKSVFGFDEVNQTLLLKCSVEPLKQLELLFNMLEPDIASKKEIQEFDYKTQIDETEEGLVVKADLYPKSPDSIDQQQQQQQPSQLLQQQHSPTQRSPSPITSTYSKSKLNTNQNNNNSINIINNNSNSNNNNHFNGLTSNTTNHNNSSNKSTLLSLPSLFPSASSQSSSSQSPPHHNNITTKSASSKPSSTSSSLNFTSRSLINNDELNPIDESHHLHHHPNNNNINNNNNNNNNNDKYHTTLPHIIEKSNSSTQPVLLRKS